MAVIPLTTFALRSVWTLPLAVFQRRRIQKQNAYRSIVSAMFPVFRQRLSQSAAAAQRRAQAAAKSQPNEMEQIQQQLQKGVSVASSMKYDEIVVLATKERRKRQKELFKKHHIQLWKNAILPAFQIPLWVMMSLTMRDLTGWNSWDTSNKALDTTLYEEGALWFANLAAPDSMHVFPVIMGVLALMNVEWTFKTFDLLKTSRSRILRPTITDSLANVSRMSVVFMMAISTTAPLGLTLYWISSQFYSLVQNVVMDLNMPMGYTPKKRIEYKKALEGAIDVIKRREDEAEASNIAEKK